jgi:hypothetical protein
MLPYASLGQSHEMLELEVTVKLRGLLRGRPVVFSRATSEATHWRVASDGWKAATSCDEGPAAMKLTNSS